MIEGSKYCSDVMKKDFNKEHVVTKEGSEDFKNSIKCWVCDKGYVDNDVKVRDYSYISGKYWGPAHRNCNINLQLNSPNFCRNSQSKKLWSQSSYPRTSQMQSYKKVIPNVLEKLWALLSIISYVFLAASNF